MNKTLRQLTKKFAIRHTKTLKYYPQEKPTELYNRTIKRITKTYLENDYSIWDEHTDDLQFAISSSKKSSAQFTSAFSNLSCELEPLQSLRKNIKNDSEIEFPSVDKWTANGT